MRDALQHCHHRHRRQHAEDEQTAQRCVISSISHQPAPMRHSPEGLGAVSPQEAARRILEGAEELASKVVGLPVARCQRPLEGQPLRVAGAEARRHHHPCSAGGDSSSGRTVSEQTGNSTIGRHHNRSQLLAAPYSCTHTVWILRASRQSCRMRSAEQTWRDGLLVINRGP